MKEHIITTTLIYMVRIILINSINLYELHKDISMSL